MDIGLVKRVTRRNIRAIFQQKKRIWKSYSKLLHRRVEDGGFFEKRQKVYALFCKSKTIINYVELKM